jgi:hypothetical protein
VDDYFAVSEIVHNPPYHAYRRYWNFHKKIGSNPIEGIGIPDFFLSGKTNLGGHIECNSRIILGEFGFFFYGTMLLWGYGQFLEKHT